MGIINLMFLLWLVLLPLCMIFYLCSYSDFFYLAFLIIGSHIVFNSILGLGQTPEEGRRTYRPKSCGNNNKDEDNSPKNLNDKNQQASSQEFRPLNLRSYLPTPPLKQDMTQGQIFKRSLTGLTSEFSFS